MLHCISSLLTTTILYLPVGESWQASQHFKFVNDTYLGFSESEWLLPFCLSCLLITPVLGSLLIIYHTYA